MRSLFDADVIRSHAPLGGLFAIALLLLIFSTAASVSAVQLAAQSGDELKPSKSDEATEPAPRVLVEVPGDDEAFIEDQEYNEFGLPLPRKPGPLRHKVTVLNEEGKPVVGATVIPSGIGMENGSSMGWVSVWPKEFTTDAQGVAEILVPENKRWFLPASFGHIRSVSFEIEHPEYAHASKSSVHEFSREPITLRRGVVIVARAINAATNQPITSELYAISSGYPAPEWTFKDGELRSVPMDTMDSETGKYFRVIHAPAEPQNAAVLLSDVIDATAIGVTDHNARIDVPLYPGVRISGQLSADVPRPLKKGGHVIASIEAGEMDPNKYPRQHVYWGDVAMIDEDGKFEFSDLPRDSHVELIAVCDGWLSKAKTEDLADYDQIHQTEFQKLNEHAAAASTPVFIERDDVAVTLNMIQLGQCEILVEDENGKPLDLAEVNFSPNHHTRGGGTSLGAGGRSLDLPHNQRTRSHGPSMRWLSQYFRTTGPDGRVVIVNLPAGLETFQVTYPGYDMPGDPRLDYGVPMGIVEVKPGATSKIIIRMKPDPNYGHWIRTGRPNDDGTVPLRVSFVDDEGAPLDGVRVNFRGQSLLQPGERQPWPTEWSTEVNSGEFTSDEAGMVLFRVRLPQVKTPDNTAKYSIWLDVECPGFVPLKDHEYSLTKPLPIRMKAL